MNYNEEDKAVRNFIIIFIIVLLIAVGMYFFTKFVVNKDSETSNEETSEVTINNSIAIVGTMLNKVEDDYFVILYKNDSDKVSEYSSLVSQYNAKSEKLALYTVDLSNHLNSKYYDSENENLTSSNINDLRFGDITLLEVKDHKIVKTYNTVEKIKKVWNLS